MIGFEKKNVGPQLELLELQSYDYILISKECATFI
jgi:hypothetical protein